MYSNDPNAMIARLKQPSRPPNAVIAKGKNRGNLQMPLSPRKNDLTPLFKEVRGFQCSCMRDTRHFCHFCRFQEPEEQPLVVVDRMYIRTHWIGANPGSGQKKI